jgi:hypothetical protein
MSSIAVVINTNQTTRRCRCGGLVKKLSCCTLLEVFKVQTFSYVMIYPQKNNEILSEPLMRKNGERKQYIQTPSSGINKTPWLWFIINTTQNCQKGKIEINFVLPLCLGNAVRHPQLLHPSTEKLNPIYQAEEEKGYPRQYTHIHMGVHENIWRKGKKRSLTRHW